MLNMIALRLNRWALGHSIEFFDNDFAGRISQKILQTSSAVTNVIIEFLHAIVFAAASLIGAVFIVGSLSTPMVVSVGLWIVAYIAIIRFYIPRIRGKSKAHADARSVLVGQIVDTIANVKTLKLFAHDDREDQAVVQSMEGYFNRAVDRAKPMVSFRIMLMLLGGILPVALVGFGIQGWMNGTSSVGEIATAGAIALRLSQMTGWVSFTIMGIYTNIGEAEDGMRTLTPPHGLIDAPDAHPLIMTTAKVEFENVSFHYGGSTGGLDRLSLTIAAGEKIGIVGASGAGKTTLVNLLLRLYDAEGGTIRVADQDIATVTQASLRQSIGMVSQDTAMFNRSAYDNIHYGNPDADAPSVYEAAAKAQADVFIRDLRDFKGRSGYDAHLGERGVKLSGGQRQRIAIARTILKDAPILILDEATSALDSEVEAAIQSSLDTVMQGKTVLAIAHRLSTIARMDRIIVLDKGRIIEDGTHDALLARNGLYARYWNRQSGGFINVNTAAE
jgi:ATP-binding cassette subfamily B protein